MRYVIPAVILLTLIASVIKKVSVFDSFVEGGKEAAKLIVSLLPYFTSIFLLIEVFEASGLNVYISKYLGYVFGVFGIPSELSELIIVRPLSGSGSLCVLEDVLTKYGADSYVGRCASAICGASDTIFYIVAVYLSGSEDKRAPLAIPISVAASFIGVVEACFICRFL